MSYIYTILHCQMLPSDLREIADEMEVAMKTRRSGESTIVRNWNISNTETIEFAFDQSRAIQKGLM